MEEGFAGAGVIILFIFSYIVKSLSHGSKYLQCYEKFLASYCYAVEMLCHQVVTVILQSAEGLTHGVSAGVYFL